MAKAGILDCSRNREEQSKRRRSRKTIRWSQLLRSGDLLHELAEKARSPEEISRTGLPGATWREARDIRLARHRLARGPGGPPILFVYLAEQMRLLAASGPARASARA